MLKTIKERPLPGTANPEPQEYEKCHAQLARRAAAEGMVLLKNEGNILPLSADRPLALFGAGAAQTVKGGTGSGDVNERQSVSIAQGLEEAGVRLTTKQWIEEYKAEYRKARLAWRDAILKERKRQEDSGVQNAFFNAYSTHPFSLPAGGPVYQTEADVAVYVVARVAGENADRTAAEGDYYLSGAEHDALRELCRLYQNVVVLINAGGVVDLSFLDEMPQIRGLLVVSQPGMEGGRAVADVLYGKVSPSGKLTDTWAFRYADYPSAKAFGKNRETVNEEYYEEGIYVGYRYFDSFGVPARYGFGYGLSYTSFSIETKAVETDADGEIRLHVTVTNTGKRAGREVVQAYAVLPEGHLEKELRRLVAFAKTGQLLAGQSEALTLRFGAEQLESYAQSGSEWIVEAGTYGICVGGSLDQSRLVATLSLKEGKTLIKTKSVCPLQRPIKLLHLPAQLRRDRYGCLMKHENTVPCVSYDLSGLKTRVIDGLCEPPEDEAAKLVSRLTQEQLMQLAVGQPDKGQDSALGSAGVSVPGSAAQTSDCAQEQGIAPIVLADGPAGLRLTQTYYVQQGKAAFAPMEMNLEHGFFYEGAAPEGEPYYQYCTAFPVGTLLAQTWDAALLQDVGDAVGREMERFGVQLWLAPGMNIHRNPLCGRNFEYFSEDPLVSGLCASYLTKGVQGHPGIGTTIKHYACNNRENDRMTSDSIVSERALREIYLKGFELAIAQSRPMAMMTSYNLVNGVHAANHPGLCTWLARAEFGFDGLIMTDWTTTNQDETCTASGCIRAGNDLIMPGMEMDLENLRTELAAGTLSLDALRLCVTRIVRVILQTNCYETV